MTPGAAVPTLDWILAGLLLLSVLVGIWRGLVFEVLSLAGWFVSYAATRQWGNVLAPWMPGSIQGEALRLAVANLTCFLLVLLVWGVAARVIRALVKASPLSAFDRLLGGGFGLLRGVVLLVLVTVVVSWTPAVRMPWWQDSIGARWLEALVRESRPWLGLPMRDAQGGPSQRSALAEPRFARHWVLLDLPQRQAHAPRPDFFPLSTNGLHPCAASSA